MSEPRFNDLIHSPTRLSIVAMLAATEWADFAFVRDELVLSESALSNTALHPGGGRLPPDP